MADTKISALTPITPVVGTMKIPMATAALANGSITPTGILAYGTDPITGTTVTTTGAVGVAAALVAGTAATAVTGLNVTQTIGINAGNATLATASPFGIQWTWNDVNAATGVKWVVTDTSSAATSSPFEILGGAAGTTSLLKVSKAGKLTAAAGLTVGTYFTVASDGKIGSIVANGVLDIYTNGLSPYIRFSVGTGQNQVFGSAALLGWWNTSIDAAGAIDVNFTRLSAGVLGVGTAAAGFAGSLKLTDLVINRAATFLSTSLALTNGAGASAGTITNAPAVGNPTKWIGIDDNGTTRYIPAW